MVKSPVVKLENVEKVYTLGTVSVSALRGVSLEAGRGEFVVIMGPSGSGKTTILNLVGALDKPTKGKVYIDGKDLTTLNEGELTKLRRNKVGFVFQFYNLVPVLTALENVELPMLIAGVPKKAREKRARELLELVGLIHRADHRPDELSGGEQQRVAIARALANEPSIILADEPTGDLDTKSGIEIMEILRELCKRERVTVIAVTHDPIVTKFANRILKIRDGRIVEEQTLVVPKEAPVAEAPTLHLKTTERHRSRLLPNLIGLVPVALGVCTLVWVGWLTWYDITTWSKSLALIFFGSRTGEAISLGIGMKVIYYFLIGAVLFLLGMFMLFRKNWRPLARGKRREETLKTHE